MIKFEDFKVYSGKFKVNTVIWKSYAFDPSVGSNVYHDVRKVFITHGHADHFSDASKIDAKVVAPKLESNMIENPEINWRGHFNWAKIPEDLMTPYFMGEGVEVDDFAENYPFSIPLPGHTYAHTGYLIENVLIAGDCVYPIEYWERFGILYYTDPDALIESLNRILELDWDYLIPGHGDVLYRDEGIKLIKENIRRILEVDEKILSVVDCKTECEILAEVLKIYHAENVKSVFSILKPVVSSHLSSLYRRKLISIEIDERGVIFKKV